MWTTSKPIFKHEHDSDTLVEMTHDFGNGVTVVTNFEEGTTKLMHGKITVSEHELIRDTENYTKFLNNIDNEVNPQK